MNKQLQVSYRVLLITLCLLSLDGCVNSSFIQTKTQAGKAGFHNQKIQTEFFTLFTVIKNNNTASNKIIIYVEGDGHAWKRKNKLSNDPTPINSISLKLAISDTHSKVAYLARPCQYLDNETLKSCSPVYWSSHRYAKEVIASMSEAITKIKFQSKVSSIELVGFSGGGVIAMLVAAQRSDVSKIITVAANIDHESWNDWHGVSKLDGSLTPLNYLADLEGIEQLHFWGGKDEIVPYKTQLLFIALSENNTLFKYKVIPDFSHDCCWVEQWQDLLQP